MRRRTHLAAVPASAPVGPSGDGAGEGDGGHAAGASSHAAQDWEATVDGTRVRISARDEVVIQCGQASIIMRRNGRVVIRGTYVETRAAGTNRIRGGQVRIN